MKKDNILKRLAAVLVCLLVVNMILSVFPSYPLAASARAAEQSSPVLDEGTTDVEWGDGRRTFAATPSDSIYEDEETALVSSAEWPETPSEWLEEEALQVDVLDYDLATPSSATPSEASKEIYSVDVPTLVTLDAGEADDDTWRDVLLQQAPARTRSGEDLLCELEWSIPYADWSQAGVYAAQIEAIPPDGYTIAERDRFHRAVISIHPPGMRQVIEVSAFVRYRRGHTWTFAMKAGQDMTPLVETLENIIFYSAFVDDPVMDVTYSAEWDFSSVDPDRPGIYPIYRSLTLMEDSLPEGFSPDEIYLPDYWENLPVLLSVEEPGGPQLYGALESPFNFFGSYAKLSEEELASLKVWYSIDGGIWTLQKEEGLMELDERNFFIDKSAMAEGVNYSFRLELGDHRSQVLTVKKDETSPVWFTCMMDGNRDGTIEVEFPEVSQPSPTDPTEGETSQPSSEPDEEEANPQPSESIDDGISPRPEESTGDETVLQPENPTEGDAAQPSTPLPSEGETTLPPSEGEPTPPSTEEPSDQDSSDKPAHGDSGSSGNEEGSDPRGEHSSFPANGPYPSAIPGSESGSSHLPVPPGPLDRGVGNSLESYPAENSGAEEPPTPAYISEFSQVDSGENDPTEGARLGAGAETSGEIEAAGSRVIIETSVSSGSRPTPEEVVTRWTTQISGKRARKLVELYPDWILFQKEEVSVLLSSQWLSDQQMRDSDVLSVSVSPGEDYAVTILINQKEPQTTPVFRITVGEKRRDRYSGGAATALLFFTAIGAAAVLLIRRRWRS